MSRRRIIALAASVLGLLGHRPAWAQREPIALVVRPRVGDTLRLQVEQTVTMLARRGVPAGSVLGGTSGERAPRTDRPDYGPRTDLPRARTMRVQLFAHSVVEASTLFRTTLHATTDSMMTSPDAPGDPVVWQAAVIPDAGRHVRVEVTPDGAMRVTDPRDAGELGATLGSLPGLLPTGAVRVGGTWRRELPLPSLPLTGYHADGIVQAELRLDSLTRGGREAWISLTGVLRRDGAGRELPVGTRVITAGTITGTMLVDRARAWIIDARTRMDVQSEVVAGPAGSTPPMWLDLRIEQRVRVR